MINWFNTNKVLDSKTKANEVGENFNDGARVLCLIEKYRFYHTGTDHMKWCNSKEVVRHTNAGYYFQEKHKSYLFFHGYGLYNYFPRGFENS